MISQREIMGAAQINCAKGTNKKPSQGLGLFVGAEERTRTSTGRPAST